MLIMFVSFTTQAFSSTVIEEVVFFYKMLLNHVAFLITSVYYRYLTIHYMTGATKKSLTDFEIFSASMRNLNIIFQCQRNSFYNTTLTNVYHQHIKTDP